MHNLLRAFVTRGLLLLWAALALVGGSSLLARHLLTLPTPPPDDPVLAATLARLRLPRPTWLALHVLSADCACSHDVLRYLRARGARSDLHEQVLLVGAAPVVAEAHAAALRARGFGFAALSPEQLLEDYRLEAAPLLVVADEARRVRYLGGYSPRKRGQPQDLALLAQLRAGHAAAPLPTFGCAVSASLRAALDPLRIGRPRLERW